MIIDDKTSFGRRVLQQLEHEQVIWLTTVSPGGRPSANPVWFFWDGESFIIFTRKESVKARNIWDNSLVSLQFNSDSDGHEVTIFSGYAMIDPDLAVPAGYLEKYREGMKHINMEPASFSSVFATAIRVTPTKVRGH